MSLNEFILYIKDKIKILPILDMFHGEKGGQNHVLNNIIKFGTNSDEINVDELKNTLEINDRTLNDKSTIGRMNDKYPIKLFQIKSFCNMVPDFAKLK